MNTHPHWHTYAAAALQGLIALDARKPAYGNDIIGNTVSLAAEYADKMVALERMSDAKPETEHPSKPLACSCCGCLPEVSKDLADSGIAIVCDCGRRTAYWGSNESALSDWNKNFAL